MGDCAIENPSKIFNHSMTRSLNDSMSLRLLPMQSTPRPPRWKTLLAFAIIYFVWGSTFLAIRIGVREVPPFLLAAMRFVVAGLVLYGWTMARGERSPTPRQWASISVLALLIFLCDYGL